MSKREMAAAIADLTERVEKLERAKRVAEHVHDYRYSKSRWGERDSFGGIGHFWSWKCENADCPAPSGGTNHTGGIPDHFPADLR